MRGCQTKYMIISQIYINSAFKEIQKTTKKYYRFWHNM